MRSIFPPTLKAWLPLVIAAVTLCANWSCAETCAEKISAKSFSGAFLLAVGATAPTEEESQLLWQIVEGSAPVAMTPEDFLARFPQSPWGASLRAHLALVHRQQGRSTRALQEWEEAWRAVKEDASPAGRSVAEFTLGHWSGLLSSLGRVERLQQLLEETRGRVWQEADWYEMWRRSAENL